MRPLLLCLLALGASAQPIPNPASSVGAAPVRLILDVDMDSDCDDVAALAVMHALADGGEVEPLAVMISGLDAFAGPCADAVNTYYGRPELPIGSARAPAPNQKSKYTEGVAKRCPHKLAKTADAPDAVGLYRKILAKEADGAVTVVTVGDMTNLAKLLKTPADEHGPAGAELVRAKVKVWVCMGGNFIGRPAKDDLKLGNNNFTLDPKSTYAAVTNWPTPIVFAGREVCSVPSGLKAGAKLRGVDKDNPVRIAYELYFGGEAKDRHVADQATVLFAVRGLKDYWDAEGPGRMALKEDMTFEWRAGEGRMAYLLKRGGKENDRRVEAVIEELMTRPAKAVTRK